MSIYLSDVRFNLVILYFSELNVYSIYYNTIKRPLSKIFVKYYYNRSSCYHIKEDF